MTAISTFSFPTRILFGPGAIHQLGSELARLGIKNPLLVTDRGLVQCGLAAQVMEEARLAGVNMPIFDGVTPNPLEKNVTSGLAAYRENSCDSVVGLGGGSALDTAKAIRLVATHPLPLEQYDDKFDGGNKISSNVSPMIAVATTAGTGSDVGRSTVIILPATDRKTVIFSPCLIPTTAICDPELTLGMPAKITAGTGLDAFTHNLEAYLSLGYHPMCDSIALGGLQLANRNLVTAVRDGKNLQARTNMMMSAVMGAVAFQKGLGAVHSLAHPLSSVANLHHGTANGILLAAVLEFNTQAAGDRMNDLARALDLEAAKGTSAEAAAAVIARVRMLLQEIGVPEHLSAFGITRAMIPALSRKAMEDACHTLNPRSCTEADMARLYEAAL
jgi:4-hydroxybutyrate dehydrogenase